MRQGEVRYVVQTGITGSTYIYFFNTNYVWSLSSGIAESGRSGCHGFDSGTCTQKVHNFSVDINVACSVIVGQKCHVRHGGRVQDAKVTIMHESEYERQRLIK